MITAFSVNVFNEIDKTHTINSKSKKKPDIISKLVYGGVTR